MQLKRQILIIKLQIILECIEEQKWEDVRCDMQNDSKIFFPSFVNFQLSVTLSTCLYHQSFLCPLERRTS